MNQWKNKEQKIVHLLELQHRFFKGGKTRDMDFRIRQLRRLKAGIKKHEAGILEALRQDLGKHENEAYMTEVGFVYHSISQMIAGLRKWAGKESRRTPFYLMPAKSEIEKVPYGTVLIIGPYNYPFQLVIEPLIGAIAAGNTAVVKPSELAPHVEQMVKELLRDLYPSYYVGCVTGGVETNEILLKQNFDQIFFTGSVRVGKIVMEQAAKNLTPVILELGGKCPVIVDETADIEDAAKKIIWGKTVNAGQTCVAPDYCLVHASKKEELVEEMKHVLHTFYGYNPEKSGSYGRIINERHFNRIGEMLKQDHGAIVAGGRCNEVNHYIEPTLLELENLNAACMQEEIFGPLLPILVYEEFNEVYEIIEKYPTPLALYLFTRDLRREQQVLEQVQAGGVCVNAIMMHTANSNLPFGGVGNSGMGTYHGKESFEAFSQNRAVVRQPAGWGSSLMYPAYSKLQLALVKLVFR